MIFFFGDFLQITGALGNKFGWLKGISRRKQGYFLLPEIFVIYKES